MPLYDFECACGWRGELQVPISERDRMACPRCQAHLTRKLSAPLGRMAGVPVQGGGADRFTADCLGIPLKELPEGLKQDFKG